MDIEMNFSSFIKNYPLSFETEPDYSKLEGHRQSLNALTNLGYQNIFVIDFYKNNYWYLEILPFFLYGHTKEEVIAMGIGFRSKVVMEEERERQSKIYFSLLDFIMQLPLERRKNVLFYTSHKCHHKSGHIFSIGLQVTPFLLDSNGNVWMALGRVSLASKTHNSEAFIEMLDTKERFDYNIIRQTFIASTTTHLSEREQMILALSAQGYTEQEISDSLYISKNTVKFHKQNVFDKFKVDNLSEAYCYTLVHKLW